MITEQDRAEFEAWHKREMWDGGYESGHDEFYPDAYRFNERRTYENMHTQIAWRAYQAGRAALQSQSKVIGYLTRNEEDDPAMMFFDLDEARKYCNLDEEPEALVLAGPILQSQDAEDADRLQAMAAEWDRARRGVDSHMPIWESLCEAIGEDADGAGMRAAIDNARRVEGADDA